MPFSLPLIRYIITAALRDRLILAILSLMLLSGVLSLLLSGTVIMEQQEFTIASLASSMRLIAVVGLVVFISFFQRRAHDYREVDYLLATPLGRYRYILSVALAFNIIAFVASFVMVLIVVLMQRYVSPVTVFWGLSAFVEISLTCTFALFLSTRLRSATVCTLITLAFYSLARLLGSVLGAMDAGLMNDIKGAAFYHYAMTLFSVVIPRFDLLAQSQWLIYEKLDGITPLMLAGQWSVFTALFLACTIFDLRRNQF
jgi:hypothetical protein